MLPELATSCLSWADSPFLLAGCARRTFGTCCAHASPANDKQRYEDSCDSGEGMCWNRDTFLGRVLLAGRDESSLEKYFDRHWVSYRISRDCVVLIEIWDKVHLYRVSVIYSSGSILIFFFCSPQPLFQPFPSSIGFLFCRFILFSFSSAVVVSVLLLILRLVLSFRSLYSPPSSVASTTVT